MGGKTRAATGLALLLAAGMAWAGGVPIGEGNRGLSPNILFHGEKTNNNSLISFVHIGETTNNGNWYPEIHKVLKQLNIGSSYVEPHRHHFHAYIKAPELLQIKDEPHLLLASNTIADDTSFSFASDADEPLLLASADTAPVRFGQSHPIQLCSQVYSPNTNYDPHSLASSNVLTPQHWAIYAILKVQYDPVTGNPTEAFVNKHHSMLNGARLTVVELPAHGKLLPVNVESDQGSSVGYFYMADTGYFGRDTARFKITYSDGTVLSVIQDINVIDMPTPDAGDAPCATKPLEYKKLREKDFEEIKRQWEKFQLPLNIKFTELLVDNSSGLDSSAVTLQVADLTGSAVGSTSGPTITLDTNAAGHGWYIDYTPYLNEEFLPTSNPYEWIAKEGTDAYGKMDFLSVLWHEYGHAMGLDHSADSHDLMAATLSPE